jgi:hypothetical protein
MQCRCQQPMNLLLRTIVFSQKVTVHNVPVYSCPICNRNEMHPSVKPQLKSIISELGTRPKKQKIYFQDVSELAKLLYLASSSEYDDRSVNDILHYRINELLDLLNVAEALNDPVWVDEIHDRLDQIQDVSRTLQEWHI